MVLPDYQGASLVNLMSSIGQAFGRETQIYPLCHPLHDTDLSQYNSVVLLVVDGLGYHYLQGKSGLLREHCQAKLTSVFPPTTATSISTFMTALAPQQHGLTGWYTYLEETGGITAVLPFRLRGEKALLTESGYDLESIYQHPVFFDQLSVPSTVISNNNILLSPYNRAHSGAALLVGYDSMAEMFAQIANSVKQSHQQQFIYAYWAEFDTLSHIYGNQSEQVAGHFAELEQAVERYLHEVSGTNSLLLITADHGFIDTSPEKCITVNEHPAMQQCLAMPLSGEPRAAYCYLKPGHEDRFVDYVNTHFAAQLECVKSSALIDQNYFGLGPAHPHLAKRVGDYTLIMKENCIIKDWMEQESYFFHYGVHGGVSELEMYVPLVVLNS